MPTLITHSVASTYGDKYVVRLYNFEEYIYVRRLHMCEIRVHNLIVR